MPMPPKSVAQLKQEGTYRGDRHDIRGDEPEAIGNPLTVDWGEDHYAAWLWDLLLPMAEQVAAGEVDTAALCSCCQWYARYRENMDRLEQMDPGSGLYCNVQRACSVAHKNWLELARDYGLTPQDRIKLAKPVSKDEEIDPLEALAAAAMRG